MQVRLQAKKLWFNSKTCIRLVQSQYMVGGVKRSLLTLDVDGDAGLLAVGHGLVGGSADDLLARLDVGGGDVEGANGALSPPVP